MERPDIDHIEDDLVHALGSGLTPKLQDEVRQLVAWVKVLEKGRKVRRVTDVPKGHLAIVLTKRQWELVLEHTGVADIDEHPKSAEAYEQAVAVIGQAVGEIT